MEGRLSKDPASGAALAEAEEAAGAWDPCACEGEGAEEGGDAAPRDATVPGARPLGEPCEGPAQSSACTAAAYADQPQDQCCPPR
jgi:hypothetical protein